MGVWAAWAPGWVGLGWPGLGALTDLRAGLGAGWAAGLGRLRAGCAGGLGWPGRAELAWGWAGGWVDLLNPWFVRKRKCCLPTKKSFRMANSNMQFLCISFFLEGLGFRVFPSGPNPAPESVPKPNQGFLFEHHAIGFSVPSIWVPG